MRTSETAPEFSEFGAQHAPGRAISQKKPRTRGNGHLRQEAKIKASQNSVNAKCSTCEGQFRSRRRVRTEKGFCSARCRLLHWAALALVEAHREGKAEGLRDILKELEEVNR